MNSNNTPSNILSTIGNTPLVPINRLNPHKNVTILAKLESFNPGGSIKDRIALNMIESAEKRGELTRDRIVLEASSGNTGIGLALVCAVKGYRCLIAMSEAASIERRKIMKAYGAEILLTPARMGTDGAIEAVYRMALEEPGKYFCTDQFNNPDNWKTHYNTTANEIWEQCQGKVDAVVSTMGTTGTLMGLARRFRELDPETRVIGVEPFKGHGIQGLKNMKESYRPGIFDKSLPAEIISCRDEDAFDYARKLASMEGIFAGMSSGAAMAAAVDVAARMENGVVVAIFPDGGERYLSTSLFPYETGEEEDSHVLRLTNTLTRKKEAFEPLEPGKAGIYSCGPTAYEHAHLGLCRRLVVADLLRRILEYQDYEVRHVMNITDIDDKTIRAAIEAGEDLKEFTSRYAEAFTRDAAELNVLPAYRYPRASEHVPDMIRLAEKLEDAGYAYERHGSLYFDVSKLPSYGRLSRVDMSRIDVGRTVDLDEYEKDSPVDFTLFKRVTLEELKRGIGYDTRWGKARPGWHIECTAMSMRYLGEFFDIHTSGCDLVFPHHENEIAMAMALTGRPLARTWVHSELVMVEGRKMSRSAGNMMTLRKLLEMGYSGRSVRFYLLRTSYRKPLNFSIEGLEDAVKGIARIDQFICDLQNIAHHDCSSNQGQAGEACREVAGEAQQFRQEFLQYCLDDMNMAGAIGAIFTLIRSVSARRNEKGIGPADAALLLDVLSDVDRIAGFLNYGSSCQIIRGDLREEIEKLVRERENARKARDWQRADAIRERLRAMNIEVIDTPAGPTWRSIS